MISTLTSHVEAAAKLHAIKLMYLWDGAESFQGRYTLQYLLT